MRDFGKQAELTQPLLSKIKSIYLKDLEKNFPNQLGQTSCRKRDGSHLPLRLCTAVIFQRDASLTSDLHGRCSQKESD